MLTIKEKLYANLIGNMHEYSRNMARMIVKPAPIFKPKSELKAFLNTLGFQYSLKFPDSDYAFDTWDKWLKAIEIDWSNSQKYIKDQYDCDNFADSFAARMAEYYGWNTVGKMSVALYKPETNKLIGYHRANLIVAKEGPILATYAYDPMTGMDDEYAKIENSFIRIKNWVYEPSFVEFN